MKTGLLRKRARSIVIYLLKVAALAVVYHLAARLGLKMAYVQANTSPVWPPTGIALAALLLFGYKLWPGVSLGVLLGLILTGAPFGLALGMAIGNTLEALTGAFCLRRFVAFHNTLDRVPDVIGLALVSVLSTSVGATIGTTTLMLTGRGDWQGYGAIWSTWWIGDLLGALVVAPVILVWATARPDHLPKRMYAEGGLLFALLGLVTWYVFGGQPLEGVFHQALIYVIFPFMIWAALRLGQRGTTAAILLVSGIAIWSTAQGLGPFSALSKNDSLVILQTFTSVVSLTSLILAAAIIERRNAAQALRQRADDLGTLNDSSRTFLDNAEPAEIYRLTCQLAVTRLGLDACWIETSDREAPGARPDAVYGIKPQAVASIKAQWRAADDTPLPHGSTVQTLEDLQLPPGAEPPDHRSYGAFPLVLGGRAIGVLTLLSKDKGFFTQDRQILLQSYANLAAVAIQNAWLLEEVRRSNKQLHALSQRLMKAQEEERLHLSRELHDESGQLLAALAVQLGLLERGIGQPKVLRERIGELKATAQEIQDNLHKLAVDLRPASLDHLGLVTTLQQYIQEFSRQYHIPVEFEAVGMGGKRLSLEVETALFRIVQESLTNVILHAQATRIDVLINLHNEQVVTVVEDDGIGFLPVPPIMEDHLGLFGMRERIEMLGGRLTVESSPGKGTTVRAEVPVHD